MNSHKIIQDAMKDVVQELLIVDKQGKSHLVFIMGIKYNDGIEVDFNSPSGVTDELSELVHEAITAQFKQYYENLSKWEKFKTWLRKR